MVMGAPELSTTRPFTVAVGSMMLTFNGSNPPFTEIFPLASTVNTGLEVKT